MFESDIFWTPKNDASNPAKFWLGNLQNPANMVMAGVTGKNLRVAKSNWNEQV